MSIFEMVIKHENEKIIKAKFDKIDQAEDILEGMKLKFK